MKAKLMQMIDSNELDKTTYGVKLTGLRRFIGLMSDTKGDFATFETKQGAIDAVKKVNKALKKDPDITRILSKNKCISGIRINHTI